MKSSFAPVGETSSTAICVRHGIEGSRADDIPNNSHTRPARPLQVSELLMAAPDRHSQFDAVFRLWHRPLRRSNRNQGASESKIDTHLQGWYHVPPDGQSTRLIPQGATVAPRRSRNGKVQRTIYESASLPPHRLQFVTWRRPVSTPNNDDAHSRMDVHERRTCGGW